MFLQIFYSDVEIRKNILQKSVMADDDGRFEHVVVIRCKILAWRAFSKSTIWLNKHGEFPRKYHGILSYFYAPEKKRDTLCKFRYAVAIVIQLFSPVV